MQADEMAGKEVVTARGQTETTAAEGAHAFEPVAVKNLVDASLHMRDESPLEAGLEILRARFIEKKSQALGRRSRDEQSFERRKVARLAGDGRRITRSSRILPAFEDDFAGKDLERTARIAGVEIGENDVQWAIAYRFINDGDQPVGLREIDSPIESGMERVSSFLDQISDADERHAG
jgi:hypothetical protein